MAPPLHKAIRDPQAFSALVDQYMHDCEHNDDGTKRDKPKLATLEGLCLKTGVMHRQRFSEWMERYSKPEYEDTPQSLIADAIKRVKVFSEEQLRQDCFQNRNAMSLALGKCMHGWVEQQHVKHEHTGNVEIVVQSNIPSPSDT